MSKEKKLLVYVAGPFRAATQIEIQKNILDAYSVATEIWELGHYAICPHANLQWTPCVTEQHIMDGCLEMLKRCDRMVVVGDWLNSVGTLKEIKFAEQDGIPIFYYSKSVVPGDGLDLFLSINFQLD